MTAAEVEMRRKRARMTQEDLARALGIYPQTLMDIGRGRIVPAEQTLADMAQAIDEYATRQKEEVAA